VPDYDAEMRPSVFDLSTLPRYRPLDLRALRLAAGAEVALPFSAAVTNDAVLYVRAKAERTDRTLALTLCGESVLRPM
jgi:hypothetical protein